MNDEFIPLVLPRHESAGADNGSDFSSFPLTSQSPARGGDGSGTEKRGQGAPKELAGHDVSVEHVEGRVSQIRVRCSCGQVLLLECNYGDSLNPSKPEA